MATLEVTSQNLQSTIENNSMVLIDFWADWCGPCKMFGPIFEKASEKYPDMVFGKCDTEAQPEVAAAFGIQSIPTLAVFKEGELIFLQAGALPANVLDQLIEKVRALDMQAVRQQATAAEQAPKERKAPAAGKKTSAKKEPPVSPQRSDTTPVVTTMASGEGLAMMADDYHLRRQGVTRAFLERAASIDCARQALDLYRRVRDGNRTEPTAKNEFSSEYERLVEQLSGALAKLDADTRGEVKGVLRAIEQLLKS